MLEFLAAPDRQPADFYRGWHGHLTGDRGQPGSDDAEFARGWCARAAAYRRYQDLYPGGWPMAGRIRSVMPFHPRNLIVLSFWDRKTLWHYRGGTTVTLDDVCAPGYLDPAANMVRVGDTIWITAADGSRTVTVTEAAASVGIAALDRIVVPA